MNVQAGQKEEKSEMKSEQFKTFMGARVQWPPEIPDDMLEFMISEAQSGLKNNNIEDQQSGQRVKLP
jgi:dynein light chain LC8-type